MPSRSLSPVEQSNLNHVAEATGDYALLFATPTIIEKNYFDATLPVRTLLARHGFHDYSAQGLGADEHGVSHPAQLIADDKSEPLQISLYRPKTKQGDPRLWPSRFGRFCGPDDALVLFFAGEILCIVNLTQSQLAAARDGNDSNYTDDFLKALLTDELAPVNELVERLRVIARNGPLIAAARDEAVGWVVETALGIARNSNRTPDYRGIEIKSGRGGSRTSLFACVPDWSLCAELNASLPESNHFALSHREVMSRYGRRDVNGRWNLYCTVSSKQSNPDGLRLFLDKETVRLVETCERQPHNVAVWPMKRLHDALATKHPKSLFLSLTSVRDGHNEYFTLRSAAYHHSPSVAQFDALLASGVITMDHRVHEEIGGGIRDHGIPFRITPARRHELFLSTPKTYSLT